MKFRVYLHSISCSGLVVSDRSSCRPYVRFNFDGFKKTSTKPLHFPMEHTRNDIGFGDAWTFHYQTNYPSKLHQKQLSVTVLSKNSILADDRIGHVAVDLHTLVTGPAKHSLAVTVQGKFTGRVHFICEVEQFCDVTLHVRSVTLQSLPVLKQKTPISHLRFAYSGVENKKRMKTDKQVNTVNPTFSSFHPIKFSGLLREIWREGIEVDVMLKGRSREKSHKMGSWTVRLCDHHSFVPQEQLSVVERVQVTSDYAGVQCVARIHCYYEGLPQFVQMIKGLHDETGVHDAEPFAEGLPLPKASFFETRVPVLPASLPGDSPTKPALPATSVLVKADSGRRMQRERSAMSIKAAREYDGASVLRREFDDEEEDSPRPRRPPVRPSSSLGMDSTAASQPSSRGMSRSSSYGNISAVASAEGKRPSTPTSQVRFLAYPPPPPPKPEPTAAVRTSLRALSISDPNNPFNKDSPPRALDLPEPSPRSSPHSLSSQPPLTPPGKFGYCAVCGRSAGQVCQEVMEPVCSYPCKLQCLASRGLFSDDQKERPPPLNPEAARVSPVASAYPSLAASPVARQPGPAGFCVVCQHPALFMCKDTLMAVCSPECKIVNLRLNPQLRNGGSRVFEPSAPVRPSGADRQSPRRSSMPLVDAAVAVPLRVRCVACTFDNEPSASVCEICSTALPQCVSSTNRAKEPPSPELPTYHLQHPPRPNMPKRPSFAAVAPENVRSAPGGPHRM